MLDTLQNREDMALFHKELTIQLEQKEQDVSHKLLRANGSSVPQLMVEEIPESLDPGITELVENMARTQPFKSRGPLHLVLYQMAYTMHCSS